MANFIGMVFATLNKEGIDTKGMSTDEAVKKFNELKGKSGGDNAKASNNVIEGKTIKNDGKQIKEILSSKYGDGELKALSGFRFEYQTKDGVIEVKTSPQNNEKNIKIEKVYEPVTENNLTNKEVANDGNALKDVLSKKYGEGSLKHIGNFVFEYKTAKGNIKVE